MIAMLMLAAALNVPASASAAAAPLPDPKTLLEKALANDKKMAEEQERYSCKVINQLQVTNKHGKVEHTETTEEQQFFVNGNEVDRKLKKDGKLLTPAQEKKEDERVTKETIKFSDSKYKKKAEDENAKQTEEMIRLTKVTSERQGSLNGRSTIFFDIEGNPNEKPSDMMGKYMLASTGTMSVDEATGEIVDYSVTTDKNVKMALGLMNTDKGFHFHFHDAMQSDGVWLTDLLEGTGGSNLGFFLKANIQFKMTESDCHLYTVNTTTNSASISK